jgi:demethylmenaquinone methyltransferase / 2-methoxy-6-polyprenyl-1,4-benzoquinol methylase
VSVSASGKGTVHGKESPHKAPARREIGRLFDRIAPRYDLLNRLLSFRRDVAWRRRLIKALPDRAPLRVLDLATGTGDVMLAISRRFPDRARCTGVDVSAGMLRGARKKVAGTGTDKNCRLLRGDAVHLGMADNVFDAVTSAFGIRNTEDPAAALREMYRVLRPGGRVLILEFSLPENPFFRAIYLAYFRHILPRIGGLISGDPGAYRYLNRSAEAFPHGEAFLDLMRTAGFEDARAEPLSLGIAALYTADKPSESAAE